MTKEDVKSIKTFDEMGMRLMGFKHKSSLKPYHNVRSSYFVYPDEGKVKGSSQVSDALIKSLLKKDKIAIVRFVSRSGSNVLFAALLPQAE